MNEFFTHQSNQDAEMSAAQRSFEEYKEHLFENTASLVARSTEEVPQTRKELKALEVIAQKAGAAEKTLLYKEYGLSPGVRFLNAVSMFAIQRALLANGMQYSDRGEFLAQLKTNRTEEESRPVVELWQSEVDSMSKAGLDEKFCDQEDLKAFFKGKTSLIL